MHACISPLTPSFAILAYLCLINLTSVSLRVVRCGQHILEKFFLELISINDSNTPEYYLFMIRRIKTDKEVLNDEYTGHKKIGIVGYWATSISTVRTTGLFINVTKRINLQIWSLNSGFWMMLSRICIKVAVRLWCIIQDVYGIVLLRICVQHVLIRKRVYMYFYSIFKY